MLSENYGFDIETSRWLVQLERVSNTAMSATAAVLGPKIADEVVANTSVPKSSSVTKPNVSGSIIDEGINGGKGNTGNNLSHLTQEQQQLIKNADNISTAKPGKQVTAPRDLNEQVLWKQVQENPSNGIKFSDRGQNLNTDARFPTDAGFQKMSATHKLPDGKVIEIHYQYNSNTGKAYDMKIVTPQRTQSDPKDVIDTIKDNVK
ncbi:hypothetical protein RHO15_06480 [Utexia brackfieldae]|uniref:hypothetical protein n=1 Tax=Utexia brackfieldae TaxID=3074108 RepID=UPI00370D028A